VLRRAITALVLGYAAFSSFGCHADEIHIDYVNQTQETIAIIVDSEFQFEVAPGETHTGGTLKRFLPDHIQAVDSTGEIRLDHVYNDDDLKEVDYTIIVR
jgi:hypothetical protein